MLPVPLALRASAPVACCRPAALYAASVRCASSAAPSASSAPSTAQPPARDLSKAATARVRHPRSIFNEALSAKRKQYLAEGKAAQQQKALAAAAEKKRREAKDRELEEKIRLFKAERARSFSDDALGGSYPFASSQSAVDALTGSNKKKDAVEVDPVFKTRAAMWRKYNAARRQQRFENNVAEREAQSEMRLESLLYLYHSARKFVTYDNVDAQVRALQPPLTSTFKFGEEQNARVFGAARRRALKDTLEGTLNDGRFGVDTLKSYSANQAGNEADEAANQKFFEERKRHLDNSRIAPGTGTNA